MRLTDDQILEIIESYKRNSGNYTHVAFETGRSYNIVHRYIKLWQSGKLPIENAPPVVSPILHVATATIPMQPTDTIAMAELRRELATARRDRDELLKEREEMRRLNQFFDFVKGASAEVPSWINKSPRHGGKSAIPIAMLSDLHLDEVVKPEQVNFVNAFNREIAEARLKNFFNHTVELANDYIQGLKYEGIVIPLGGDIFSGIIHEELIETNAATIFESLLYWAEPMASGIRHLRDAFGRVFLPCVVGNHGRRQRKPHAKHRAQDNFDYFFYHLLQKLLSKEKGISWAISESADQPFTILTTRYLLTHGDQFKGGSGIAGLLSPLMLGDARKRQRETSVARPYDYLVMGHWHQLSFVRNIIVNGCFPAGQKVTTSNGSRDIIKVQKGDFVMSKDGSQQEVTHKFERKSNRLIGLKVYGLPDILEATPNHLIWASKASSGAAKVTPVRRKHISDLHGPAQWIPIDFLSPGDYVHVPFPKGENRPIDAETAWAYGLYIAEGNALLDAGASKRHHRINLTMHIREEAILQRWAKWFESVYNRTPRITLREKKSTSDLVVSVPRELSIQFREMFGHTSKHKHLPQGALFWANDLKCAILDGWITGDGHRAKQKDCRDTVSASTISEQLAWQMFYLAKASGFYPSINRLKAGGPRLNDTFSVHLNVGQHSIDIDGERFYQVSERFERHGDFDVYDLEVSGEHTYTVNGVGVHNSLKGMDEYAFISNFGFEPPQQAFWITDAKHKVTITAPIHVVSEDEQYTAITGEKAIAGMGENNAKTKK